MKKVIALFLTFILLVSGTAFVFADDYSETLSAVGILPAFSHDENSPVTRDEFAFMTARLLGKEYSPMSTRFADVGESNAYSGYIEYLASINVVAGHGNGYFHPTDYVTYAQAAKMLVNVLGYDAFGSVYGGFPNGYIEALSRLGLSKGVTLSPDSILTVSDAVKLVHNALTMELNSISYTSENGELNTIIERDKKDSVLADVFGISVYEGIVNSVNDAGTRINVLIERNKYDSNPVELVPGEVKNFGVVASISADSYLNVPAVLWVDGEENIIKIATQRDVEVKYASIASINNDTSANFPISNIDTITLLDDENEYDVSEDAVLYYNGKVENSVKNLNGNFAKIVIKNNEIAFIESWDLIDGGLITNSDGNTITYKKNGKTAYLRDVASYKKVVTVIGTQGAKVTEIKADSVFMYYQAEDYLVIVVSEKNVVDSFVNVSDKAVQIGEATYRRKTQSRTLYDSGNVSITTGNYLYFSEDGENFTNSEFVKLLSRNVKAYIGPDGYVWVIKAVTADSGIKEFYGIVKGVEVDNMDPEFGQVSVIEIGDSFTESVYDVNDKTIYNDSLSLNSLGEGANEKALSGEGIYVFEVSSSGKLVSVSLPDPIYGYRDTDSTVASFGTVACVKLNPHYIYWNGGQKMLVIYEKNDSIALKWTTWTELYEQTASLSLKVRLFGKGTSITPSLIVLASGATPINELGSQERYGVITNIMDTIDENGEPAKEISMVMKSGNKKYIVKPEAIEYEVEAVNDSGAKEKVTRSLRKNTVIKFREDLRFSDNDILILDKYAYRLPSDIEEWLSDKASNVNDETDALPSGWKSGIAAGADASRLLLETNDPSLNPESMFFHITMNFIAVYDTDAPVTQFRLGSWDEIDEGDTVFYNNIGDGTRGVIIVK